MTGERGKKNNIIKIKLKKKKNNNHIWRNMPDLFPNKYKYRYAGELEEKTNK